MNELLVPILVPNLGESITRATVVRWLKTVGEVVTLDQLLIELETDKITLEVNAPKGGVLAEIVAPKGQVVKIGEVLGYLRPNGPESPEPENTKLGSTELNPTELLPTKIRPNQSPALPLENNKPQTPQGDLGNGDNHYLLANPPPAQHLVHRQPLSPLRLKIAARLKHAQNTAAILTTFNEVDLSAVQNLRNRYRAAFLEKYGVKLGIMSFFIKAATYALREIPIVNSHIDGEEVIYNDYYDIGVAVAGPEGLVVPIIRHGDNLNYGEIEQSLAELSQRAKDYQLTPDDLRGGTFTISNGGVFGSLLSTPILNPPQSAILGLHKIQDRPVAINGQVEIRPMMYLALSYDHRLIDGREAVTFLKIIKDKLENLTDTDLQLS